MKQAKEVFFFFLSMENGVILFCSGIGGKVVNTRILGIAPFDTLFALMGYKELLYSEQKLR